ncbi:MAG TPA: putative lipid II flippase FtsW [Candidatus Saccharimonadales bacterium]|nr:putative lipid II flippase FtsW [Candidatus Saccharimonadales bacterium]
MKTKHHNVAQKAQAHRPDLVVLALALVLVLFGLLMIYNASPVTSERDFGDPTRLARLQVIWALGGAFGAFIIYKLPYQLWEKLAPIFMLGAIVLLLLVFVPHVGITIYGAQRWIGVGKLFAIQPSEFAKLAYIIYLSAYLSKRVKLWPFVTLTGLLLGILLVQRDLGTAMIISMIGLMIYFLSGAPIKHFLMIIPVGLVAIGGFILSSAYRRERFLTFLHPSSDPQGAAYHINQILIALGSGGWFGVGLGQSRQKYGYIPEITTDSIFAVIGNELGFIGSLIFISLPFVIVFRAFRIAGKIGDRFGQLLASGIGIWIGVQVFINLAGMVALLPLTGVPLPFISYGGSSLLSAMFGVAILLNISKNTSEAKN